MFCRHLVGVRSPLASWCSNALTCYTQVSSVYRNKCERWCGVPLSVHLLFPSVYNMGPMLPLWCPYIIFPPFIRCVYCILCVFHSLCCFTQCFRLARVLLLLQFVVRCTVCESIVSLLSVNVLPSERHWAMPLVLVY